MSEGKGCELLNRDIASLVGVNFGNKYCVTCSYFFYLVLVDLELVLPQSTLVCCFSMQYHMQVTLGLDSEVLIQTGSVDSTQTLYSIEILILSEVSTVC